MQLMHCGRAVVSANRGYQAAVVAPSALPCPDPIPGPDGVPVAPDMPRALHADELPMIAEEHAQAARNALDLAAFDHFDQYAAVAGQSNDLPHRALAVAIRYQELIDAAAALQCLRDRIAANEHVLRQFARHAVPLGRPLLMPCRRALMPSGGLGLRTMLRFLPARPLHRRP